MSVADAAGDGEVQVLAGGGGDHDLARLQAGDQRRMLGRDAQLAQFTGGHDQGGFAAEDLLLGTDDVATDGAHGTLFAWLGGPAPTAGCRRGGADSASRRN